MQKTTTTVPNGIKPIPEIAVYWEPTHPRSQVCFNVPLKTTRTCKLMIIPRVTEGFSVIIKEPCSSWLKLSKRTGKVPFNTLVTIDTTNLGYGEGFKEHLEFQVDGVTIYKEPIYLTTQVYEPKEEAILQRSFAPLHAGKPRRNIFISIYTAFSTAYSIAFSFVVVVVLIFIICLVLVVITAATQ